MLKLAVTLFLLLLFLILVVFMLKKNRVFLLYIVLLITIFLSYKIVFRIYKSRQIMGNIHFNASLNIQNAPKVGNFELRIDPDFTYIYVINIKNPDKVIWSSVPEVSFLSAAFGIETLYDNSGFIEIEDTIQKVYPDQTVDEIITGVDSIKVSGVLYKDTEKVPYTVILTPSNDILKFDITLANKSVNRLYLTYKTDKNEKLFGLGTQFSKLNLKGEKIPMIVREKGFGRDRQPMSFIVDYIAGFNASGSKVSTYFPLPHYVTDKMRSLFLENNNITEFDFRDDELIQLKSYGSYLKGGIIYSDNIKSAINSYTSHEGRPIVPKEWILEKPVFGIQGGTEKVLEIVSKMKEYNIPISAVWIQDWCGQRTGSSGMKRVWWNWIPDEELYPDWNTFKEKLSSEKIKILGYVNPYLVNDYGKYFPEKRDLFKEASEKGFLVKNKNGENILIDSLDFKAGIIDLGNPQAVSFLKNIISENILQRGFSGYMADFAEAFPFTVEVNNGDSVYTQHNLYPVQWAKFNKEIFQENSLRDGVFCSRSGWRGSTSSSPLFWTGDQFQNWMQGNGLHSAMMGILTAGLSGAAFYHSDVGGYVSADYFFYSISRSRKLFYRWMEFSAMTSVFRTHEGNRPEETIQFYTDQDTLRKTSFNARLYKSWFFYRKKLAVEAAETGLPIVRAMFLNYPEDELAYKYSSTQYMCGDDILFAPVLEKHKDKVEVYLPKGEWVHIWSNDLFKVPDKGKVVIIDAPVGTPALFCRRGTGTYDEWMKSLKKEGLL